MKKKFLAIALAAAMALTVAPAMPANTTVAEAADAETLTSAAWWTGTGISRDYSLSGDGSVVLDIDYTEADAAGNGAFSVEVYDDGGTADAGDGYYFTTGSDKNGWVAELATSDPVEGIADPLASDIVVGHKYQVTVTRSGADFTVTYMDTTDNKEYCKLVAKNTNFPTDLKVHFMAQLGTYTVNSSASVDDTPVTPSTPTEAPQTGGEKPATDFSGIETQPTFKYTFDSADEVKLFGDAAVADGILNLAKDATSKQTTYAQIDDFTSVDFTKGVTITADVNVKDYASDWTSLFMFGDGSLGGNSEDATAAYHFSQGFSSQDIPATKGYFGNAISAPYTWDYFSKEENRNKWYTIAVTISPTNMTTYINGQAVQTKDEDYTSFLDVFKVAKNNYLGASYWAADPDFAGSMDNVGIYNVALSAEEMGKLTTAEKTDIGPGGESSNKKQILLDSITAKAGSKKVSGTFTTNVTNVEVSVQVNKGAAVKTTANGKKFSVDLKSKLKGGDKVTVTMKGEGYYDKTETATVKYTNLKVKKVTAKKNAKKITGTVTVKKATVKVKVGKKAYKKAKVSGKNFTLKVSKLKKGTKVTVKATKKNYVTATKSVKVK